MFVIHYIKDILLQIYIKIAIYKLVGIKKSAFSLELSLFSGYHNNAPSINEQHLLICCYSKSLHRRAKKKRSGILLEN